MPCQCIRQKIDRKVEKLTQKFIQVTKMREKWKIDALEHITNDVHAEFNKEK